VTKAYFRTHKLPDYAQLKEKPMDPLVIVAIVALIFLPPLFLFRPLVVAIANRIAGKQADSAEVKRLKGRVELLEQQVSSLQHRVVVVEDASEFSKKMLEDLSKNPADAPR
jgi:hypothetical protein